MHAVARQATGGLLDAGDVDGAVAVVSRRTQRSRIAVPSQGLGLREESVAEADGAGTVVGEDGGDARFMLEERGFSGLAESGHDNDGE